MAQLLYWIAIDYKGVPKGVPEVATECMLDIQNAS